MTNDYSDYYELSYRERWELKRAAIILKRKKMIASVVQCAIIVIAIVLFFMYATTQTSVGLMGGILCAGLGVKNLLEFLHLRKREQENQDDQ